MKKAAAGILFLLVASSFFAFTGSFSFVHVANAQTAGSDSFAWSAWRGNGQRTNYNQGPAPTSNKTSWIVDTSTLGIFPKQIQNFTLAFVKAFDDVRISNGLLLVPLTGYYGSPEFATAPNGTRVITGYMQCSLVTVVVLDLANMHKKTNTPLSYPQGSLSPPCPTYPRQYVDVLGIDGQTMFEYQEPIVSQNPYASLATTVTAVDLTTSAVIWKKNLSSLFSSLLQQNPFVMNTISGDTSSFSSFDFQSPQATIYRDLLIVPAWNEFVFAFNKSTGEVAWVAKPASLSSAEPSPPFPIPIESIAVGGQNLVVYSGVAIHVHKLSDGVEIGRIDLQYIDARPLMFLNNSSLLFLDGYKFPDGSIQFIPFTYNTNTQTKSPLIQPKFDLNSRWWWFVVANQGVLGLRNTGSSSQISLSIDMIDPASRNSRMLLQTPITTTSGGAVVASSTLFVSRDHQILAVNINDAMMLWKYTEDDPTSVVFTHLHVGDGVLVAVRDDLGSDITRASSSSSRIYVFGSSIVSATTTTTSSTTASISSSSTSTTSSSLSSTASTTIQSNEILISEGVIARFAYNGLDVYLTLHLDRTIADKAKTAPWLIYGALNQLISDKQQVLDWASSIPGVGQVFDFAKLSLELKNVYFTFVIWQQTVDPGKRSADGSLTVSFAYSAMTSKLFQFPPPGQSSDAADALLSKKSLITAVLSHANILVTSPDGKRIGTDPATGQAVKELDGYYTGPDSDPQVAMVFNPADGHYRVQIFPVSTGTAHVVYLLGSNQTQSTASQIFELNVVSGQMQNSGLNVSGYTLQASFPSASPSVIQPSILPIVAESVVVAAVAGIIGFLYFRIIRKRKA